MEHAALNRIIPQAHQQHRRADSHLRYRRFSEAIECHRNAAELLSEALNCTHNPRSVESIKLQRDFHLRQKDIILVKKEQFENYRKAIENQRNRMVYNKDYEVSNDNQSTTLQVAIYRTMEEADSLLGQLINRGNGGNSDSESLKSYSTTDTEDKNSSMDALDGGNVPAVNGSRHPKDDTVVIEELRTLNEQLHSLVYRLVTQLDASTREVDMLRERVKQLEGEKGKERVFNIGETFAAQTKNCTNSLKVATTDSSGGTSPYVFSPCSDFSSELHFQRALPVLAPLEMPNFDFSNFVKNNSNPNFGKLQ